MSKVTCLLDLDGVLVDCMQGAHKFHSLPYDYETNYPYPLGEWDVIKGLAMSATEFWSAMGHKFWANLHWMPDGKEILSIVEKAFGPENIYLLTCPTLNPGSASGKLEWIQKHLPKYDRQYLIGPSKSCCAGNLNHILIDDADHNIKSFRDQGGMAILLPRKWNQCHALATVPCLRGCLSYVKAST